MSQRVDYEAITGARFDQYPTKLRIILSFLQQPGSTKFKAFRDFVRKQNMWDKDRSEVLYSLMDITWDKTNVKIGKTAKRLMTTKSDQDFQTVLFDRLKELNILLVKYVLEALDVQQGGRLHSIHELYRMITSYVYPGKYITLTAFQAWIDWLAAAGAIRMIGIRWGLSERGQKIVPELRAMDLDEILEDMEDDDAGSEGDDDVDDEDEDVEEEPVRPAARAKTATAPAPAPARTAPPSARGGDFVFDDDEDGGGFDEEDLFSDLPPEPEPPSEAAIRAASARLGVDDEDDGDEVAPPPRRASPPPIFQPPAARGAKAAAPAKASAPVATPMLAAVPAALSVPMPGFGQVVLPAVAFNADAPEHGSVLDRVASWHEAFADWPSIQAFSLGVVHRPEAGDLAILTELGVLAVLAEGREATPQMFAFARKLQELDFFATLIRGGGFEAALDGIENLATEPWARTFCERLMHAKAIVRRANEKIDLLYQLKQVDDARAAIDLIRDHLVGPLWREAPFFVLRELVRLGVLTSEAARGAVVVPNARLIANAGRLGIVRAERLDDFNSIFAVSRTVSQIFGAERFGYGLAVERLDLGLN